MALDIGPKTTAEYSQVIAGAKTIIWNGPMGVFEMPPFDKGTVALAKAVAASDAVSVVGGGDSEKAVEALTRVVIDLSGRPGLQFNVEFTRARIGEFDVDLTHEFFQGFANHALVTLHIDNLHGDNAHHQCETIFKAFGRALRMAMTLDPRSAGVIPSTKGSL